MALNPFAAVPGKLAPNPFLAESDVTRLARVPTTPASHMARVPTTPAQSAPVQPGYQSYQSYSPASINFGGSDAYVLARRLDVPAFMTYGDGCLCTDQPDGSAPMSTQGAAGSLTTQSNSKAERFKEGGEETKKLFWVQVRAIAFSGIVLLIALTWDRTFDMMFARFFDNRTRLIGQLIYAAFITALLFGILYLVLSSGPKKKIQL